MKSLPLVSVLMCTYNAESFIEPTIRSIINQTYENLEINILDNNSTDSTIEKIKQIQDSRINLYEKDENLGPYRGLNYLIKQSNGEYIAIQDHDDVWHEEKLELQIDFLEKSPEYVGCGGQTIKLFEHSGKIAVQNSTGVNKKVTSVPHTTLVFRNEGFTYDTSLKYKTDLYFMENILCRDDNYLYKINKPLHISLVRGDNANLSLKWTSGSPENIIDDYKATGRIDRLIWGLFKTALPTKLSEKFNMYIFSYEFKDIEYLSEYEFTRNYLKYVDKYI